MRSNPEGKPLPALSNADVADRLAGLAQLMSLRKENPYKIKAYQRAAARIRNLSESLHEMVRAEEDLTQFSGVGDAIASAIREIIATGTLKKLELLHTQVPPAAASLANHPRLDPRRVMRVYKKLEIDTVDDLRQSLESGDLERVFGPHMAQHVRQGLTETHAMLLYRADDLRKTIEEFLVRACGISRAEATGAYRRRVDVIEELVFVIETHDFPEVIARMQTYGGRTPLVSAGEDEAVFSLSSGILLRLLRASKENWGLQLVSSTGSKTHLKKLTAVTASMHELKSGRCETEAALYRQYGLQFIPPELREGFWHPSVQRHT